MSAKAANQPATRARSHIIERPRLTKLLDESKARIILLVAQAGYGKTTLATEWCGRPNIASSWFRARPTAADVSVLAIGLAEASEGIVLDAGSRMRDRLLSTTSADDEAEELAELLATDLESWPSKAWLVIDDYHQLSLSQTAELFVKTLFHAAPINLLITTRRRPTWVSGREMVYGDAYELDQQTLALTHAEAREILMRGRKNMSILEAAKGWPAVVGLAALTPESDAPATDIPAVLYDYFAAELFTLASSQTQRAVCVFSLARTTSREAADYAFRQSGGLAEAAQVGLLNVSRHRAELHPLLARFLVEQFDENGGWTDDAQDFALFLLRQNLWDAAFAVIEHIEQYDLLLDLIHRATDALLAEGRLVALEQWIAAARGHHLAGAVVDRAEAEVTYRHGNYRTGEALAVRAAEQSTDGRLSANCYLVAGRCAHLGGRDRDAISYHSLQAELAEDETVLRTALWGKFVSSIELDPQMAAGVLEQLESFPTHNSRELIQLLAGRLDLGRRLSGLIDAVHASDVSDELLTSARDPLVRTHFLNARAGALVAIGAYDEAAQAAKSELSNAHTYRLRFVLPHAFIHLANAYVGARRFKDAADALKRALTTAAKARDRYSAYNARVIHARLLLAKGRHDEAERLLSVEQDNLPMAALREEYVATRALALACAGNVNEAFQLCERPSAIVDLQASTIRDFAAAIAAIGSDGADQGSVAVLNAAQACIKSGYVDCLVLAYRAYPPILAALAASRTVLTDLQTILHAAHDYEAARSIGLSIDDGEEFPIESLSGRELEVLGLLAEGMTNREIAKHLFIAESTAKLHVHHILGKLSVRTRTEAALIAARHAGDGVE
jgi:LuxR family transcriptional regulator, maltose regulon positive regulatory protein